MVRCLPPLSFSKVPAQESRASRVLRDSVMNKEYGKLHIGILGEKEELL